MLGKFSDMFNMYHFNIQFILCIMLHNLNYSIIIPQNVCIFI